jgi:hypothetical protein
MQIRAIRNRPSRACACLAAASLLLGAACATSSSSVPPLAVATQELPSAALLSMTIGEFDPGVEPGADSWQAAFDIREAESRFVPVQLKQTLQGTGQWGPIWVMPRPSEAADLHVEGELVKSDGEEVAMRIRATDSRGRVLLSESYEVELEAADYSNVGRDPYQAVYNLVANDLLAARQKLSPADLAEIAQVADLRFAAQISPEIYGDFVRTGRGGQYEVARLPATNDPNLTRIRALRERELLFMDTLNEHYSRVHLDMEKPYRNWRSFARDEAIAYREVRNQAILRAFAAVVLLGGAAAVGADADAFLQELAANGLAGIGIAAGYAAFQKYLEAQVHTKALDELADSFSQDVAPRVVELESTVVRLTGTADEQYAKWRELLRKLYETEVGLGAIYADATPPDAADAAPEAAPAGATAPVAPAGGAR